MFFFLKKWNFKVCTLLLATALICYMWCTENAIKQSREWSTWSIIYPKTFGKTFKIYMGLPALSFNAYRNLAGGTRERALAVALSRLWNSHPRETHLASSPVSFWGLIKSELSRQALICGLSYSWSFICFVTVLLWLLLVFFNVINISFNGFSNLFQLFSYSM